MKAPKAESLDIKCPNGMIWSYALGRCISIVKGESLYKAEKYEPDFGKTRKK